MSNLGKRNMFQEGFDPRSTCNCGVYVEPSAIVLVVELLQKLIMD